MSTSFPDLSKVWWLFLYCKQYTVRSNSTALEYHIPANTLEGFIFLNEWKASLVLSKLIFAEKIFRNNFWQYAPLHKIQKMKLLFGNITRTFYYRLQNSQ